MKFKDSVRFKDPKQAIVFAAIVADQVYQKYGHQLTITSWNDGTHSTGSLHYKDAAFDCRTKDLPDLATKQKIRDDIVAILPPGFDVLLEYIGTENEHIHIEADLD